MLESLTRVTNFCWAADSFQPSLEFISGGDGVQAVREMRGQYGFAVNGPEGSAVLVRDRLGINKLFFAFDGSGRVLAANYLLDLVQRGIAVEEIYSVPAGHITEIDVQRQTLSLRPYFDLKAELGSASASASLQKVAHSIRQNLEVWFSRLALQFSSRKICLCLSGGLDSGLIAALAKKFFPDVVAYT